jgi:hypothetical protein
MAEQYYSVRPKTVFQANDVIFYPGRGDYIVAESVYNGKTDDGQANFMDLCESATPVNAPGS